MQGARGKSLSSHLPLSLSLCADQTKASNGFRSRSCNAFSGMYVLASPCVRFEPSHSSSPPDDYVNYCFGTISLVFILYSAVCRFFGLLSGSPEFFTVYSKLTLFIVAETTFEWLRASHRPKSFCSSFDMLNMVDSVVVFKGTIAGIGYGRPTAHLFSNF